MNSEVRIGGETYPLLFGRQSAEEMGRRTSDSFSPNGFKLFCDLVYSGWCNHATANDYPFPTYQSVYELVEAFYDEDDSKEQQETIWDVFYKSKWGAEYLKKIQDAEKKSLEMIAELDKIGMN